MTSATLTAPARAVRVAPVGRAVRFELLKLLSQWRVRGLLLACWTVPAAVVAVVSRQSSLPADTLVGRWMGTTGWAGGLVVLSFSGSWLLPLLASLVGGDVFASEDRLGTWQHLLGMVRSPRRVFAAKALAGLGVLVALVAGVAVSSTVGGLASVGSGPLVGLSGQTLSSYDAGVALLLGWSVALAATLAFWAVGLLGSVVLGRSTSGLLLPAVLAVVLQVAQLLPLPVAVRVSLPTFGFVAWRGLLTEPGQSEAVVVSLAVSLTWVLVATGLALAVFVRRDFTEASGDGRGPVAIAGSCGALAAVLLATAAAVPTTGAGIVRTDVERAVATSFGHLYRLQARELGRPDVTEQQLATTASCDRGGPQVADSGAGNDWRCVLTWHLPGAVATGSAVYQLDLAADGRLVADGDGPQSVNGSFPVRGPRGPVPNPLWQFDASVGLLHPS